MEWGMPIDDDLHLLRRITLFVPVAYTEGEFGLRRALEGKDFKDFQFCSFQSGSSP